MFFNKKNKELKKEVANLTAINKEYEEKCEYYQEKYLQIKTEYVEALKRNENFNNAFRESFSELSSKEEKDVKEGGGMKCLKKISLKINNYNLKKE